MEYKCLNKQIYTIGEFKIAPIRFEDRGIIMKWRNQQMYHLRQNKILTIEDQNLYFENVVKQLFIDNEPKQLLFSFFEKDKIVGYGGIVHVDWENKNAEISFILDTENESQHFENFWMHFLKLIEEVSFENLHLHKLYTYAFDLRPKLYNVLESYFYIKEAELRDHVFFNNTYINVIIHSKINARK